MATELENLVPEADVEVEGMRGPKGDKGDSYVLTEADKEEIARKVDTIIDAETDKTLSISGKPADAKAAGDEINNLKADLSDIEGILQIGFNKNVTPQLFAGTYNGTTGSEITESADTNWRRCCISVSEGEKYKISVKTYNYSKALSYVFLCDDNNVIMSVVQEYSNTVRKVDKIVTIETGVSKMFVRSYTNTSSDLTIFTEGSAYIDKLKANVTKTVSVWYNSQMINGSGASAGIGTINNNSARLLTSKSVSELKNPVRIGDRVSISLLDSSYSYAYSVVRKRTEDTVDILGEWTYHQDDVDFGVYQDGYLIVMIKRSDGGNISIAEADNISVKIQMEIPDYINDLIDTKQTGKWYGKTATFIGDSITYGVNTTSGNIYYQILAELCGFSVTGMGVAGSCYSVTSNYGTQNSPIATRWENIPDSDLICLFAGTNDYGHSTPMGTIADTTDISFYGALRVVIGGLVAKYPSRRLVVMTPLHRYNFGEFTYDTDPNGAGNTLKDYVDAIKDVCELYGVPVIDTFRISGLNPMVSSIYTNYVTDGLHPNSAGHHVIANRIAPLFEIL